MINVAEERQEDKKSVTLKGSSMPRISKEDAQNCQVQPQGHRGPSEQGALAQVFLSMAGKLFGELNTILSAEREAAPAGPRVWTPPTEQDSLTHNYFMEETWRNGEAGTSFQPLSLLAPTTIAKLFNYKHKKLTK